MYDRYNATWLLSIVTVNTKPIKYNKINLLLLPE